MVAMTIMPISLFIAWIIMFFVKDTGKEIAKHEQERNVDSDDLDPATQLA
jgi:hypothetical protein